MILGEVLSNKYFIISARIVCTWSMVRFIDPYQDAMYQVIPGSMQYAPILYDQLVQTGSQEIWLVKSQSVNSIQPAKFHTSTGCPAPVCWICVPRKHDK